MDVSVFLIPAALFFPTLAPVEAASNDYFLTAEHRPTRYTQIYQ